MALSRGDCRGGTDRYLKAALGTSDAKISERANKVAAECQQIGASAKAARRWQKLEPDRADAAAAVALAAVRLYQPDEASAAILRTHELGGDEALIKLIGELSDAGGTAITLNTLRPMLESKDVSDKLLIAGVDLALENFDFATAHKLADRVLANEPASGDARAQLARVLTAEGRLGRRHRDLAGSRGARPRDAALRLRRHAAAPRPPRRGAPGAGKPARRCLGARRGGPAPRQARLPDGRHDRGRPPLR